MRIKSNVGDVIGRLQRFETQFPAAMREAMQPERSWLPTAKRRAVIAMESVARTADERKAIPAVASSIMVEYLGADGQRVAGMQWTAGNVGRAQLAIQVAATRGGLGPLFDAASRGDLRALIAAWVATPEDQGGKRRDERDLGSTDEEIVHRLLRVLDRSASGDFEAVGASGVAKHLAAFGQTQGDFPGLSAEVLDRFLRAVLAAWVDLLVSQMPAVAIEALRRHWKQVR